MITEQGYIPQLVRCFEEEGVVPVPIFINGIEAHTVVRCKLLLIYQYTHSMTRIGSRPPFLPVSWNGLDIGLAAAITATGNGCSF